MKENPFSRHTTLGLSGPAQKSKTPDAAKNTQEKLDIKVRVATPEDWQAYKEIRLFAINSKDAGMFGPKAIAKDKAKTDEDWKADLAPENKEMFVVLSFNNGSEVVSMGRASYHEEKDIWRLTAAYTKELFRGKVSPRKVLTEFLNEIQKRSGSKVRLGVRAKNKRAIRLYGALGFKMVPSSVSDILKHPIAELKWREMELDLNMLKR